MSAVEKRFVKYVCHPKETHVAELMVRTGWSRGTTIPLGSVGEVVAVCSDHIKVRFPHQEQPYGFDETLQSYCLETVEASTKTAEGAG